MSLCSRCSGGIPGGSGQPFGFSVVAGVVVVVAAVGRGFGVSTAWR